MVVKNAFKHMVLITRHKWVVFKLCCRLGEYWRGLTHDLSKYSPTEFFESIKYYTGTHSPINEARKYKGYSDAWLHHKGRNKHHAEYWVDEASPNSTPVLPYKYAAEMICDKLAAGIIYEGKNWTKEYELEYWNNEKDQIILNDKMKEFITAVLEDVAEKGIEKSITKQNVYEKYKKYCC